MIEPEYKVASATRELAILIGQTKNLRSELMSLRRDISVAKRELAAAKRDLVATQLELVPARRNLARMAVEAAQTQIQLTGIEAPAFLRAANEQLVLAALHAESLAEVAVNDLSQAALDSQRDVLTDTPNRALMLDRLETAIAIANRNQSHIAVLFLDLDHFKQINDTLGHGAGDEILQLVARRLESIVRDSDTVSRHSGDEFLVLLTEVKQPSDAALIATKMLYALSAASHIRGQVLHLSTSIGIAIYPEDGRYAEVLINKADAAMYQSKRKGHSGFEFYRGEVAFDSSVPTALETVDSHIIDKTETRVQDLREANTKLVIAALTAQEMESRAQAAHSQQLQIMATIAHELRNPLSPIRTAAGMLNNAREDELMHSRLQGIIERQVVHMSRLVEDLLDGSRLNTGKFNLECVTLNLIDILSAAIENCRHAMDKKQHDFQFTLPSEPICLDGDPVRLTQVFNNLLDNAAKYTPQGGIIKLTVSQIDTEVTVTITDNGIGISEAALPLIFDLFVQDTYGLVHHAGGLGIGLAVVRDLVEGHHGQVTVQSDGAGTGSRFDVVLPLIKNDQLTDL